MTTVKKRVIRIASLLLAIGLFIAFAQAYYFPRQGVQSMRMKGFYLEDKDSLDVVLLGASEVYSGFSSAYAYSLKGFTSYPFALEANPVNLWKSQLKEILKTQSPRLVVVELNGALYDREDLYSDEKLRRFTDCMPMSENKIETVRRFGTEDELSYYATILKYHSRWYSLKNNLEGIVDRISMEMRGYALLRGVFAKLGRKVAKNPRNVLDIKGEELLSVDGSYYLRDFIKYCRFRGQDILFVRFPHLINGRNGTKMYRRSKVAGRMVRAAGYKFLDLESKKDEMGIKRKDFYNDDHLNPSGQKKLTRFLAGYIADNYDIKPVGSDGSRALNEKQISEWDKSAEYIGYYYNYYKEHNKKVIKKQKKAKNKGSYMKNLGEDYALIKELEKMKE